MTVIRRVERCPQHGIPAIFELAKDGPIKACGCPIQACRNGWHDGKRLGLPVIDPPEVVAP